MGFDLEKNRKEEFFYFCMAREREEHAEGSLLN